MLLFSAIPQVSDQVNAKGNEHDHKQDGGVQGYGEEQQGQGKSPCKAFSNQSLSPLRRPSGRGQTWRKPRNQAWNRLFELPKGFALCSRQGCLLAGDEPQCENR